MAGLDSSGDVDLKVIKKKDQVAAKLFYSTGALFLPLFAERVQ
jgi:hypothetical protein